MTAEQAEVEKVNTQFYKALEACDIKAMDDIWLHENWVRCIHPGSDPVVGWQEVRESWAEIFSNTRSMKLSISNLFIKIVGEMAWVECTEDIATFFDQGFTSGQAQSTNLYLKIEQKWRMVHHHVSPLPTDVPDDWSDDILN
ncbi:MAG: nuclear transport factor 2 family protein [Blastocatellia bacterium]|nr:nuclear transport factor 2 family protein [Blastocatellia bacterium]